MVLPMVCLSHKQFCQQDNVHDRNLYTFDKLIVALFYLYYYSLYKPDKIIHTISYKYYE